MRAVRPGGSAVSDRPLVRRFCQEIDGFVEQPFLLRRIGNGRRIFVNPAVDADFVPTACEDRRDHLGVKEGAHGRNEKRRGNLMSVEQLQDARQSGLRTEIAGRQRRRRRVAACEQIRFVVDVEAETHGDARAVRPRRRCQLAADAGRPCRAPQLVIGPSRAGIRRT